MITVGKNQSKLIPVELYSLNERHRLDVVLAGENASVEVVGLVLGKGDEVRALEAYITHAAPNTKSNVNVRAVLRGKSQFDFRGNVKIEKGACGADAYLRSDALLFDEAKMGDDTPALEILEPDVKAGHAATVGKVDEQMLFYLMSRGLSREEAERMLVEGFIAPLRTRLILARSSQRGSTSKIGGQVV
ncbi:SufD family Fe-S cluster assembly protein [Candidatus Curtissbacteria bacterium]|nr:SufD family Fe-S cluster assembly protein [Candidatus Curtissbacteria bacterium]